jgi:hypothetical protein
MVNNSTKQDNNTDLMGLFWSPVEDTDGVDTEGKNRAAVGAILKKYRSEIDNVNATRVAAPEKRLSLKNFERFHRDAVCPQFFSSYLRDHYTAKDHGHDLSEKMKFNRLAVRALAKAAGPRASRNMKIIGRESKNGVVLLLKDARFCNKVQALARAAGLKDRASRIRNAVVGVSEEAAFPEFMVLKVEQVPDIDTAEIAFKENEVHRQLGEHVAKVAIDTRKHQFHVFRLLAVEHISLHL